MSDPIRFQLTRNGCLHLGEAHKLRDHLVRGFLCVTPSDTCYALAGLPFRKGVSSKILRLLDRPTAQVPLTFGTLAMAERFAEFHRDHYALLDQFAPGPITVVAPLKHELDREHISSALNTDGTVGIRIPDSNVERQISCEVDRPITTCALYYANGSGVRNFTDAIDIVCEAMDRHGISEPLAAVSYPSFAHTQMSTVVESRRSLGEEPLVFGREGAIDRASIIRAVDRWTYRDVDDWT